MGPCCQPPATRQFWALVDGGPIHKRFVGLPELLGVRRERRLEATLGSFRISKGTFFRLKGKVLNGPFCVRHGTICKGAGYSYQATSEYSRRYPRRTSSNDHAIRSRYASLPVRRPASGKGETEAAAQCRIRRWPRRRFACSSTR